MSNQYDESAGRHPEPEPDPGPEAGPDRYGEGPGQDSAAQHAAYEGADDTTAHQAWYAEATQPVDPGTGTGAGTGRDDAGHGQGYAPGYDPAGVATGTTPRPAPPRGASWATVAFGLVCAVVAGLALTLQLADVRVDWEIAGPATVVGLGLLLVLVGVVGLLTRRGDEDD